MKRIGIATGAGDCPGLNTVIRAVAKPATVRGWATSRLKPHSKNSLPRPRKPAR